MKQKVARDALVGSLTRVRPGITPKKLRKGRRAEVFAVLDHASKKQVLVGLVRGADALNVPHLSFADLITEPPPRPIPPDAPLDEVLKRLRSCRTGVLPVCDETGSFLGAITWASLCRCLIAGDGGKSFVAKQATEDLQRRTQQLEAVLDAMVMYVEKGDWSRTQELLAGAARSQTASEYAFLGVVDTGPVLRIHAYQGIDWAKLSRKDFHGMALRAYRDLGEFEYEDFENPFGRIVTSRRSLVSEDLHNEPGTGRNLPEGHRLRQFLGVPMMRDDDIVGFLAVANTPKGYATADEETLEILARTAGVLLESHRRQNREDSLQEQLRQSQKMEALGRLASGIAHDFNNLLTVITGHCLLLERRMGEAGSAIGNIEQIRLASERSVSLTKQLLTFSRRHALESKVLDLNEVLENMLPMVRRLIGEDIELVQDLQPGLGQVTTDPDRMQQLVMNLVVNARDAMPRGGRLVIETMDIDLDQIYLTLHPIVKPGRYVMLSVTDTGIGMNPEVKSRAFEPFFTTKEPGTGTGLGLATVYGIVKQSGGYIWVYSEPGHGTSFKVYMPRTEIPGSYVKESTTRTSRNIGGTETLLLVEDEDSVREVAREILLSHGYTVPEARDGIEALDVCRRIRGTLDLLLTDVIMPRMNGRELAERILTMRPGTRVLYMSGYPGSAIAHHGVLDVGESYLQKPFTLDALLGKVREVLDVNPV